MHFHGSSHRGPDKALPREQLEDRIQQLIGSLNMCVLSTFGKDGPIASPIEYYADGLDIYCLPDPGTPKLKAMQKDPRISYAVHHPISRLAQRSWRAGIRPCRRSSKRNAPGWEHGMKVFRWHEWMTDLGMDASKPFERQVARIVPDRILYTETWLWKLGYGAKQVWRRGD